MDPRIKPRVLAFAALLAGSLMVAAAIAQVADSPARPADAGGSPGAPTAQTPPIPPDASDASRATMTAPADVPPTAEAADNEVDQQEPRNQVVTPTAPPQPARAQAAILRVLDKVTAETMAFEAPIGKRIRYKSLVFEVKTCVTRGAGEPLPQPSAYLSITSDAGAATGAIMGSRQVFKGWMFANAPGLNALKHPVYDAWLVACNAATPVM